MTTREELEREYQALQDYLDTISSTLQNAHDRAAKIASIKQKHTEAGLGSLHQSTVEQTDRILDQMEKLQDEINKL